MKRLVLVLAALSIAASAQASDSVWMRAAYWDARYPTGWVMNDEAVRDTLRAAGYEILNADQLKTWMTARIEDKKLSVVVFTKDIAPDTVVESASNWCTLRKYLNAGGKVVWYGDIPFYYQGHSNGTQDGWWGGGAVSVLGFDTSGGPWESGQTVTLTPKGVEWGLTQKWVTARTMMKGVTTNLTVLAADNNGNASGWVKHYLPDDDYRGFVRFLDRDGAQPNVQDLMRVAEYASASLVLQPAVANGIRNSTKPWDLASTDGGAEMPSYVIHGVHETTAVMLNKLSAVYQAHTYRGVFYVAKPSNLVSPTATGTINVTWPAKPSSLPFTKLKVFAVYHSSRASLAAHPLVGDAPIPQPVSATAVRLGKTATGLPAYDLTLQLETGAVPAGNDGWISVIFETNGSDAGWVASDNRIYSDVWTTSVSPGQVLSYNPAATAALDVEGFRLKHHWKLDEGQGTVARDSVGGSNGSIIGCNWTDGLYNKALFFPGPGKGVSFGKDPNLMPQHLTLSAWAKPEPWNGAAEANPSILTRASSSYRRATIAISAETGKWIFAFGPGDVALADRLVLHSGISPEYGEWSLLTGARNGRKAALYVNGNCEASAEYNFVVQEVDAVCQLGTFHGTIDDARIYDGALSANDVLDLYLWEPPAEVKEDFESRTFSSFPWYHAGEASWWITSNQPYAGNYCAQAGGISDGESSILTLAATCNAGTVSFYVKTSSEGGFDTLAFLVDGAQRGTWSGEQSWKQESFTVTAGLHTFQWVYSKDGSSSSGADTAWLDNIVLPIQ